MFVPVFKMRHKTLFGSFELSFNFYLRQKLGFFRTENGMGNPNNNSVIATVQYPRISREPRKKDRMTLFRLIRPLLDLETSNPGFLLTGCGVFSVFETGVDHRPVYS